MNKICSENWGTLLLLSFTSNILILDSYFHISTYVPHSTIHHTYHPFHILPEVLDRAPFNTNPKYPQINTALVEITTAKITRTQTAGQTTQSVFAVSFHEQISPPSCKRGRSVPLQLARGRPSAAYLISLPGVLKPPTPPAGPFPKRNRGPKRQLSISVVLAKTRPYIPPHLEEPKPKHRPREREGGRVLIPLPASIL
jgi:hypothetical protein